MKKICRIKCNNIEYRKGFIDITPEIHTGFINIETWDIDPEIDISEIHLKDGNIPENGVTSNTEIEMTVGEAEELITLLQHAIKQVREK